MAGWLELLAALRRSQISKKSLRLSPPSRPETIWMIFGSKIMNARLAEASGRFPALPKSQKNLSGHPQQPPVRLGEAQFR